MVKDVTCYAAQAALQLHRSGQLAAVDALLTEIGAGELTSGARVRTQALAGTVANGPDGRTTIRVRGLGDAPTPVCLQVLTTTRPRLVMAAVAREPLRRPVPPPDVAFTATALIGNAAAGWLPSIARAVVRGEIDVSGGEDRARIKLADGIVINFTIQNFGWSRIVTHISLG